MEQLKGLPLGRQLILGAGVLLLIDTFLHWQSVDIGPFTASRNGWHGFWGVLPRAADARARRLGRRSCVRRRAADGAPGGADLARASAC